MSDADFTDTHQTVSPYYVAEMNVLVFDIEPTGVSKTNDQIVVIGLCYSFIDKTNASQRVASHCSLSRCAHRADHDRDLHPEVIGVDVADE